MQKRRTGGIRAAREALSFAAPWSGFERLLLALVCTATLLCLLITPPFQAPDENQHYMKALLLSEGRLLADERDGLIGAELPRAAIDLHRVDFPTEVPPSLRRFDAAMLAKAWAADQDRTGTIFAEFPNVASYAPTLYAPGAAGLLIGDAIGLPRIGALYIGRLANALTALVMLALAIHCLPFGRMAMLGVALLPTFSYQIGSLSPDAVINGVGFLGLALALRVGFMGQASRATLLVAPLLPLALIALSPDRPVRGARTVFATSALLLLLIAIATLWDSFWVHGFVTSDGMPPHQSITRTLLLPSPRW